MKDNRKETLGSAVDGNNLFVPRALRAKERGLLAVVHVDVVRLFDDAEVGTVLKRVEGVGSDKVPCREETAVKGVNDNANAGNICAECGH